MNRPVLIPNQVRDRHSLFRGGHQHAALAFKNQKMVKNFMCYSYDKARFADMSLCKN
jgi:hypothetical protein